MWGIYLKNTPAMALNLKDKLKEQLQALNKKAAEFLSDKPEEKTAEPTEQKFAELPLEDGTVISIDTESLAVGSAVKVKNEAGELIAIPDGDYKCMLPDGTMASIKVEAGIVTELTPIEAPPAEPAEQEQSEENPPADNFRAEIDEIKSELASLKEQIKALSEGNNKLASDNESSKAIVITLSKENELLKKEVALSKEILKDALDVVQTLAESPATEPTQKPANKPEPSKGGIFTSAEDLRKNLRF